MTLFDETRKPHHENTQDTEPVTTTHFDADLLAPSNLYNLSYIAMDISEEVCWSKFYIIPFLINYAFHSSINTGCYLNNF